MGEVDIRAAIVTVTGLVLSVCVHEWGHAFVADKLGDGTPRSQGRVTLNQLAHIDPVGTLLIPAMAALTGGRIPALGWGKPVFTNPTRYTRRLTMHRANMLVAAAGPGMNLVFAFVLSLIFVATMRLFPSETLGAGLFKLIQMNLGLMVFNLLPIPPLDGGTVLKGFLPRQHHHYLEPLERYGFIILLGLLVTGLLDYILMPFQPLILGWLSLLLALIR